MKQDIINKLISFFKTHDKNLLDNPAQLKKQFLESYGSEYQLEIAVFCRICASDIAREMNNVDKNSIIVNAAKINPEIQINEKFAVLFLGCFAYIKGLITIDVFNELSLYKPLKNETPSVDQKYKINPNINTAANNNSFIPSISAVEQTNKHSGTQTVLNISKKQKTREVINKSKNSIAKKLAIFIFSTIGFFIFVLGILVAADIVSLSFPTDNIVPQIKINMITEDDQKYAQKTSRFDRLKEWFTENIIDKVR